MKFKGYVFLGGDFGWVFFVRWIIFDLNFSVKVGVMLGLVGRGGEFGKWR